MAVQLAGELCAKKRGRTGGGGSVSHASHRQAAVAAAEEGVLPGQAHLALVRVRLHRRPDRHVARVHEEEVLALGAQLRAALLRALAYIWARLILQNAVHPRLGVLQLRLVEVDLVLVLLDDGLPPRDDWPAARPFG